ncbi:MAG: hypothetical protein IPG05_10645 [Gemmatimonadetes bacterium]|nr:hypothetical protein [Gemmatimonadota bacterium]
MSTVEPSGTSRLAGGAPQHGRQHGRRGHAAGVGKKVERFRVFVLRDQPAPRIHGLHVLFVRDAEDNGEPSRRRFLRYRDVQWR